MQKDISYLGDSPERALSHQQMVLVYVRQALCRRRVAGCKVWKYASIAKYVVADQVNTGCKERCGSLGARGHTHTQLYKPSHIQAITQTITYWQTHTHTYNTHTHTHTHTRTALQRVPPEHMSYRRCKQSVANSTGQSSLALNSFLMSSWLTQGT